MLFLRWTSSYETSLTSLRLEANDSSIRQLPCPNLVELRLESCSVQLCASTQGLGLLHSCTSLTRLALQRVTLLDGSLDGPAGAELGAVAQLQDLQLAACRLLLEAKADQTLREQLVPQLTCLTALNLSSHAYLDENERLSSLLLPHISRMVRLQKLSFNKERLTPATLPGIEHLTALEDLELYECSLKPACLLPMTTGLTRLHLQDVQLHPSQAQQEGALGASQLLQLLARLTALQELELGRLDGDWPQQQLSAQSALTASSNLRQLSFTDSMAEGVAWSHVFPTGRKAPHLGSLWGMEVDASDVWPAPFSSADVTRLVSCCPALQELHMFKCDGASLAPLQSLTALTFLCVGSVTPDAIRSHLAGMTQLQRLQVAFPPPAPGEEVHSRLQHLVPLTELTGLTWLDVQLDPHSDEPEDFRIENKAPEGSAPKVWLQLLELCGTDPAAQPAVISCMLRHLDCLSDYVYQHVAQLAALSTEATELRGRLQAADTRVQGLEEQLQASDGKVQALQQQVQAADGKVQALQQQLQAADGRVQVLERQMQEVLAALQRQP